MYILHACQIYIYMCTYNHIYMYISYVLIIYDDPEVQRHRAKAYIHIMSISCTYVFIYGYTPLKSHSQPNEDKTNFYDCTHATK